MAADFVFAGAPVAPFVLATMDAAGGTAAQEAMRLIGGELVAHVPLAGAAVALESISGAPVMVVDLSGAPDDLAHDATRALDTLAAVRAWRTVIAMSVSQIDLVMAALGDGADMAHLLCAPDQGEWIGALAVAAARGGGSVRAADDDRERLARLNAEVARIASLLARIGASEDAGRAEEPRVTFAPTPADSGVTAGAVRDVLRARRLRDRFFGTGLFEDPAWDMLLDLFAARLEGGRVSVSSLCIAASVAPTTALRWIGKLTAARLLHRAPDPTDRRRAFVALTDDAAGAMHRYVAALAEARLPFV